MGLSQIYRCSTRGLAIDRLMRRLLSGRTIPMTAMKRPVIVFVILTGVLTAALLPAYVRAEMPVMVKTLNFVFSHGAGGNSCTQQLLTDTLSERIPSYIQEYELANPGVKVEFNVLNRCYPNDVDLDTWAVNLAESVDQYLPREGSIVLIGHSMGGKAALYGVAKSIGSLADRTVLVVTINSPVPPLNKYFMSGGASFQDLCRAAMVVRADRGVCNSVATYDSYADGDWVARNRHWLAFVSGEDAPLSAQFNYGGMDMYPRDMDDGALPVSAMYGEGADVVYYGQHGHSDFGNSAEIAEFLIEQILKYLFGGDIECSVMTRQGSFGHRAPSGIGKEYWADILGDVLGGRGSVWHWNPSYIRWQEWEDIVVPPLASYEEATRSRFSISKVGCSAVFTSLEEARWLEPDNADDCRLYLKTSAAPRNSVRIDWEVYLQGRLDAGLKRDRWEIEVTEGTPLSEVHRAAWLSDDPGDVRVLAFSRAEKPFRWFEANWRIYYKEHRWRKAIEDVPAVPRPASAR